MLTMTDPIQWTNPPQQGSSATQAGQQQWHTDDILGWENIFMPIPETMPEDDDLPYGDVLEKKYQFDPIPDVEPVQPVVVPVQQPVRQPVRQPVQQPVQQPVAPVQHVQAPVQPVQTPVTPAPVVQAQAPVQPVAPVVTQQPITTKDIQDIEEQSSLEQSHVTWLLDTKLQTDVQKKFGELFFTSKKIYETKEKLWTGGEDTFDILWADNDKIFISYRFLLDETNEPMLFITKIEQEKETEEETVNELRFTFNEETSSLEVMINDTLLFDEIQDFTADQKKKMQVVDKLNKFTFLASEELRKLEKEIKAKEEAEQERKKLQEIFRNF